MGIYRQKQVLVDAIRFTGEIAPIMKFIKEPTVHPKGIHFGYHNGESTVTIKTPRDDIRGSIGDWIVRTEAGELSIVAKDIFEAKYEPMTW